MPRTRFAAPTIGRPEPRPQLRSRCAQRTATRGYRPASPSWRYRCPDHSSWRLGEHARWEGKEHLFSPNSRRMI